VLAALMPCDYGAPTMRPVCLIVGLFVSAACSLNNPGDAPSAGKIYFPTAVAVADGHLLVANSNFDVRYSSGSVQAYDLAVLNEQVDACAADGDADGCDCRGNGSPCVLPRTADLLASEVFVDSFATGMTYSAAADRVYVPTRSNGGLTFISFADGTLSCGQGEKRCTAENVAGTDPGDEGFKMPPQPTSVVTGSAASLGFVDTIGQPLDGEYVLVGDQDGTLSLFIDESGADSPPTLRHLRPGFPGSVTAITVGDGTAYLATSNDNPNISSKFISKVGFDQDPDRRFVESYPAGTLTIADFGGRSTVRALAFLPGSTSELLAVTLRPSALVRVDLQRQRARPTELLVDSVVTLGSGPSKVEVGAIGGSRREFAFVSCFDSREILVVDVALKRVVSAIQGLTGPFSLALDPMRPWLYVGDFRSSTVRIVDLAPLVTAVAPDELDGREPTSPRVIAILGRPTEVQALK